MFSLCSLKYTTMVVIFSHVVVGEGWCSALF